MGYETEGVAKTAVLLPAGQKCFTVYENLRYYPRSLIFHLPCAAAEDNFQEPKQAVAQKEVDARRRRMRIYGLDYRRTVFLSPRILVENFFRFGLRQNAAFIESHAPKEVQWVTGSSVVRPYILLTFRNVRDKKEVQRRRGKIDVGYRPHGNPISIRDDLSSEEENCLVEAQRRCKALQSKGFAVVRSECSSREEAQCQMV